MRRSVLWCGGNRPLGVWVAVRLCDSRPVASVVYIAPGGICKPAAVAAWKPFVYALIGTSVAWPFGETCTCEYAVYAK